MNGYSGPRPRTLHKLVTLLALGLACLLVAASPASAAKRQVPFGFLGSVVDPALNLSETDAVVDQQYALMAQNGVESIRTNFYWSALNPAPNVYDWSQSDKIMLAAGRHGLDVLPIVEFTPIWASSQPGNHGTIQPPADFNTFKLFMAAIVQRYGPTGSFWVQHPELKKTPIRDWQIWNKPAGDFDWKPVPWYPPYVKLLKAGYEGIKAVDKGATVVSGAVVGLNTTTLTPWQELSDLYRSGARKYMDVVAVNAFTAALHGQPAKAAVDRNLQIYQRVRRHVAPRQRQRSRSSEQPRSAGRRPAARWPSSTSPGSLRVAARRGQPPDGVFRARSPRTELRTSRARVLVHVVLGLHAGQVVQQHPDVPVRGPHRPLGHRAAVRQEAAADRLLARRRQAPGLPEDGQRQGLPLRRRSGGFTGWAGSPAGGCGTAVARRCRCRRAARRGARTRRRRG